MKVLLWKLIVRLGTYSLAFIGVHQNDLANANGNLIWGLMSALLVMASFELFYRLRKFYWTSERRERT